MSHNVLTNVTDLIGDLNRHKEKSIQQKTKKKKRRMAKSLIINHTLSTANPSNQYLFNIMFRRTLLTTRIVCIC